MPEIKNSLSALEAAGLMEHNIWCAVKSCTEIFDDEAIGPHPFRHEDVLVCLEISRNYPNWSYLADSVTKNTFLSIVHQARYYKL